VCGRTTGWAAAGLVATQCFWLAAMMLLGRVVMSRATQKLVVQGG